MNFGTGTAAFDRLPLYESERELQLDLENHPHLIARSGETDWRFVKREVHLNHLVPGVRPKLLDAMFIRTDGYPALIEAKIARNDEVQGAVVAQLLRYWRAYTLTEIAEWRRLLQVFCVNGDLGEFATFQRARKARLVLAVDSAPIDLVLTASALRSAGKDIDVIEIRRTQTGLPVSRIVSLDPINRCGSWAPLVTKMVRCGDLPLGRKNGNSRATLLDFPSSGMFRVLDAPEYSGRARHQVDPARPEGLIGVMPNLRSVKIGMNPYPTEPARESYVRVTASWMPWIDVARCTWDLLASKRKFSTPADIRAVQERLTHDNSSVLADPRFDRYFRQAIRDTLLDLHLYGLAEISTDGRDYEAWPTA